MIRVVVAEDSPTVRHLLVEMLRGDAEVEVVGEARDGAEAVELVRRLAPDVVTMDIEMPVMDGLEATREIMARTPTPIVIVTALADTREGDHTFEATRAGALSVLPKPVDPGSALFARHREQLLSMVKAMAQVKVIRRRPTADDERRRAHRDAIAATAAAASPRRTHVRASLVAIATSTGGPPALRDLLAALPPTLPVPILVVQHIARGFVDALAHWLASESGRSVTVAADGVTALPGAVYLAPDDRHLGVALAASGEVRVTLSDAPPLGGFRPSGSALFESAARTFGGGVIAVILTGMGSDGVSGLRLVRERGGRVVAQDEATSVIYGMPREAVRAGVVDAVLPLPEIAAHLVAMTRGDA